MESRAKELKAKEKREAGKAAPNAFREELDEEKIREVTPPLPF